MATTPGTPILYVFMISPEYACAHLHDNTTIARVARRLLTTSASKLSLGGVLLVVVIGLLVVVLPFVVPSIPSTISIPFTVSVPCTNQHTFSVVSLLV